MPSKREFLFSLCFVTRFIGDTQRAYEKFASNYNSIPMTTTTTTTTREHHFFPVRKTKINPKMSCFVQSLYENVFHSQWCIVKQDSKSIHKDTHLFFFSNNNKSAIFQEKIILSKERKCKQLFRKIASKAFPLKAFRI